MVVDINKSIKKDKQYSVACWPTLFTKLSGVIWMQIFIQVIIVFGVFQIFLYIYLESIWRVLSKVFKKWQVKLQGCYQPIFRHCL